jgi:molybdopterin biosynthesis enzyme
MALQTGDIVSFVLSILAGPLGPVFARALGQAAGSRAGQQATVPPGTPEWLARLAARPVVSLPGGPFGREMAVPNLVSLALQGDPWARSALEAQRESSARMGIIADLLGQLARDVEAMQDLSRGTTNQDRSRDRQQQQEDAEPDLSSLL